MPSVLCSLVGSRGLLCIVGNNFDDQPSLETHPKLSHGQIFASRSSYPLRNN